jgi:hypothetical protein
VDKEPSLDQHVFLTLLESYGIKFDDEMLKLLPQETSADIRDMKKVFYDNDDDTQDDLAA